MSELPPPSRELALRFQTALELRDAMLTIIGAARRQLVIYTRDLEPPLLDRIELLDAIRAVAMGGRGASIRILVQDPTRAIKDGHRLIEQSRRLSSIYHFRQVHAEDMQYPSAFAVNDDAGFLFRNFGDRHDGEGHTHHPARANALLRYFNEVWERSAEPAELRTLGL